MNLGDIHIIAQLREENRLLRAEVTALRDYIANAGSDPIITASEQNTGECAELKGDCA